MPQPRPTAAPRRTLIEPDADLKAQAGQMPTPPDLSAKTHAKYRPVLYTLTLLAKAGDVDGLRRQAIMPNSSSRRALAMYRDLCVVALTAQRSAQARLRAVGRQRKAREGGTADRKA